MPRKTQQEVYWATDMRDAVLRSMEHAPKHHPNTVWVNTTSPKKIPGVEYTLDLLGMPGIAIQRLVPPGFVEGLEPAYVESQHKADAVDTVDVPGSGMDGTVEIFNPHTGEWEPLNKLNRFHHNVTDALIVAQFKYLESLLVRTKQPIVRRNNAITFVNGKPTTISGSVVEFLRPVPRETLKYYMERSVQRGVFDTIAPRVELAEMIKDNELMRRVSVIPGAIIASMNSISEYLQWAQDATPLLIAALARDAQTTVPVTNLKAGLKR